MTRQFIADALYGDHLPSGSWCVLIPNVHCLTHLGIVLFPEGETFGPLFLRCTDVGGFRFAGQAHDTLDPACWERDGAWIAYPPPCVGVSPVIYDLNGVLHRSNGSVGSQGYRYVNADNQIISGDATYGPFHGLFEYTYLEDGLWIGQGADDGSGIRVWDGSTLRQLELGTCRFLRANRVDEAVALAFTRPEGVALIATTMAELRALPPVVSLPAPQPPSQPPVPLPPQEPSMPVAPNQLTALQAIAAAHPEINRMADGPFAPNRGGITQLAAVQFGFPFGRKSRDGSQTNLSDDALCYRTQGDRFEIYDILSGGDGSVQWDYAGTFADGQNGFFVVPAGAPTPTPVPVPSPQPVPADLSALVARIGALEAAQRKTAGDVLRLADAVDTLNARPAPVPPTYQVIGGTSRAGWPGHSHRIDIRLEPING